MRLFARIISWLPFTVNASGRKHNAIVRVGRLLAFQRYRKVKYGHCEINMQDHPVADIIQFATRSFFHDFRKSAWGKYMQSHVKRGDVYWDIGANLGGYAFLAKQCGADVYAFEPMPTLFDFLRDNPSAFGTAYPFALSNQNGRSRFYTSSANVGGCSLVGEDEHMQALGYDGFVDVEVRRADSLVGQIPLPNWIKIDVEGNELATVEGLLGVIQASRVHGVWCEVRGASSDRNPNSFIPVCHAMSSLGFTPFIFDGNSTRPFDVAQAHHVPQFFDLLFLPT
ncbi:MAG: FkbM family methyltransferase [Flavobacteriales bacterium]